MIHKLNNDYKLQFNTLREQNEQSQKTLNDVQIDKNKKINDY